MSSMASRAASSFVIDRVEVCQRRRGSPSWRASVNRSPLVEKVQHVRCCISSSYLCSNRIPLSLPAQHDSVFTTEQILASPASNSHCHKLIRSSHTYFSQHQATFDASRSSPDSKPALMAQYSFDHMLPMSTSHAPTEPELLLLVYRFLTLIVVSLYGF